MNNYQENLKKLAELAREKNVCIVTATQIRPVNDHCRVDLTENNSNIVILDYIDIIGEK